MIIPRMTKKQVLLMDICEILQKERVKEVLEGKSDRTFEESLKGDNYGFMFTADDIDKINPHHKNSAPALDRLYEKEILLRHKEAGGCWGYRFKNHVILEIKNELEKIENNSAEGGKN